MFFLFVCFWIKRSQKSSEFRRYLIKGQFPSEEKTVCRFLAADTTSAMSVVEIRLQNIYFQKHYQNNCGETGFPKTFLDFLYSRLTRVSRSTIPNKLSRGSHTLNLCHKHKDGQNTQLYHIICTSLWQPIFLLYWSLLSERRRRGGELG